MRLYNITIEGCDDYTEFKVQLTEEQAATVKMISDLSKKTSTYGCMPTLSIEEVGSEG